MKKTEKLITVYLTTAEYEQVKKDADCKHMTMAGYIRFLINTFKEKSISEILKKGE